MSQDNGGSSSIGDIFLSLKETLEKDLENTGFVAEGAPCGGEPKIRGNLREYSEDRLRDLYDEFLAFYSYLTDEIVRCTLFLGTTKARFSAVQAGLLKAVQGKSNLKNAEARKGWIETDSSYIDAQRDYLYFKLMHEAQEERRRKISKNMDRISREIWFRNPSRPQAEFYKKSAAYENHTEKEPFKHGYKPLS